MPVLIFIIGISERSIRCAFKIADREKLCNVNLRLYLKE